MSNEQHKTLADYLELLRGSYATARADRHDAARRGHIADWHAADARMAELGRLLIEADAH